MNKSQLIDTLASRFGDNRRTASDALDAVLDTITRTVVTGEKVGITGFGVFEKLDKPARTVRNPATGAQVKKKKMSVPRFRPGAELKAYVNGEKKFARVPARKTAATKSSTTRSAATSAPAKTTTKATAKRSAAAKTTPTKATPAKATRARAAATTSGPGRKTTARRSTKS